MASVNVLNIGIHNNPSPFLENFAFEVTFECFAPLADDLEWKVVYIGSAESQSFDQELSSVMVGPVPVGINRFVMETPPPELMKIPEADRLGVTAVLLMCLYRDQEFFRVGYYVNNELKDAPPVVSDDMDVVLPPPTDPTTLIRNILVDQPRVTRFPISWE